MGYEDEMWGVGENAENSYSKNEIDKMMSDLFEDIMAEVKEVYHTPKQGKSNYFRIHPKRVAYKNLIKQKLFEYLNSGGYIDEVSYKEFNEVFSGSDISTNFKQLKWSKQLNLCCYLFQELADKELIASYRIPKKIELIFGISGVSQKIKRASDNVTLLPGDILGSGTVGWGSLIENNFYVHRPLAPGDKVELEIEGIGRLSNVVA